MVKTKMSLKLLVAAALTCIAFAAVGVSVSSACSSGYGCGYSNLQYGGKEGSWAGSNQHLSNFTTSYCSSGTWNDCIRSDYNNGNSCSTRWYVDWGYMGAHHTVGIGSGDTVLSSTFDRAYSSITWC